MDRLLMDQLGPKLQAFFDAAQSLTEILKSCVRFPQVTSIACLEGVTPTIPPGGCDACDVCCLCATTGKCDEKCLQLCPCTKKFCTDVNRVFKPIWALLTVLFIFGLGFTLIMLSNSARALRR